jgi:hypothetical protein
MHQTLTGASRLSFFGPMYALITLFIYILQAPREPHIQSDLALMDVGVGHFARIQFATASEISFSFAKEMSNLAHEAVEKASRRYADNDSVSVEADLSRFPQEISDTMTDQNVLGDGQQSEDPTAVSSPLPALLGRGGLQSLSVEEAANLGFSQGYMNPFLDLELENWSTFLPAGFDDDIMDFPVI